MKKVIFEDLRKKKLSNKSLKTVCGGGLGTDLPPEQRLKVSRQKT
ncbi:hypothetical protein [Aquimarina aggregata]|nr:hypothetical protein [Aquimarina aggregata]